MTSKASDWSIPQRLGWVDGELTFSYRPVVQPGNAFYEFPSPNGDKCEDSSFWGLQASHWVGWKLG